MESVLTYQYFGLYAFIALLCGLSFIVWRWFEGRQYTFSQHVAIHKRRVLYYALLFSVVLPLLLLFFIGWFVPAFQLSQWFSLFIVISSITQYACTLIPEIGGWRTRYHRALAGISAIALLPPLALLLTSNAVTTLSKAVSAASLIAMASIICLVVAGKGKHSHFLYLQAGYFAAFFAAILFTVYLQ